MKDKTVHVLTRLVLLFALAVALLGLVVPALINSDSDVLVLAGAAVGLATFIFLIKEAASIFNTLDGDTTDEET